MLKLRSEMMKSNPLPVHRLGSPNPKSAGGSTVGSVADQSKSSKAATRQANLNYKIFKEYVAMYGVTCKDTLEAMHRFGLAMNESSSIDKRVWFDLLKYIRSCEAILPVKQAVNLAV